MKAALARRVFRIERHCSASRRTHFIWREPHEGQEVIEARKRAMIRSGQASPIGRFITAEWRSSSEGKG
jgi:hypothetical protein